MKKSPMAHYEAEAGRPKVPTCKSICTVASHHVGTNICACFASKKNIFVDVRFYKSEQHHSHRHPQM